MNRPVLPLLSLPSAWVHMSYFSLTSSRTKNSPFSVEYVPELRLWFGLSGEARDMAAADLSSMDSHCLPLPEEWKECEDPQLVNLGSGKFCIARFFRTRIHSGDFGESIALFTGVEVVPHVSCTCNDKANKGVNEKVELRMVPHHKTKCHAYSGCTIDVVL